MTDAQVSQVAAKALVQPTTVDRRTSQVAAKALIRVDPSLVQRNLSQVAVKVLVPAQATPGPVTFTPPAGIANLSASAPTILRAFTPPAGTVNLSAPVPTFPRVFTPPTGTISLTGTRPIIPQLGVYPVPVGMVNLTAPAPTQSRRYTPPTGTLNLSSPVPTATSTVTGGPSVVARYYGTKTTSNPTVSVATAPAAGDVVVVVEAGNYATPSTDHITSVSGLGATWTKVSASQSDVFCFWIGTGATAAGTITGTGTSLSSSSNRVLEALVVRGVTPNTVASQISAASGAVTTPALSATSSQIVIGAGYSDNAAEAITGLSPTIGWTEDAPLAVFTTLRYVQTATRVPATAEAHTLTATRASGSVSASLLVLGSYTAKPPPATVTISAPAPNKTGAAYAAPAGLISLVPASPNWRVFILPAGQLVAQPVLPRYLPAGAAPEAAVALIGDAGTASMNLQLFNDTPLLPTVYGALEHAGWWKITRSSHGDFTATITAPTGWQGVLEVFERSVEWTTDKPWSVNWVYYDQIAAAAPGQTINVPTTANRATFLRIHPYNSGDAVPDAQISWGWTARAAVPVMTVHAQLKQAPGSVLVSLGELPVNETVMVSILNKQVPNNPVLITETDEDGTAEFTVPVPTMLAGVYNLEITVGTVTLLGTLTVLSDPLDDTTPDDPDYPGSEDDYPHDDDNNDDEGYARDHPRHWKFKDVRTGKDFQFPHNPASWSGIERPNWFEYDSTTAPDGQELVWQAAGRAQPFEVNGYLDSHEFYDELVFWSRIRRRFWLRDHRNRWWWIAIEQFDPRRRVVPNKPWAHDYTIRCVQFMGPMGEHRDIFDDEDDSYDDHRHGGHDEE